MRYHLCSIVSTTRRERCWYCFRLQQVVWCCWGDAGCKCFAQRGEGGIIAQGWLGGFVLTFWMGVFFISLCLRKKEGKNEKALLRMILVVCWKIENRLWRDSVFPSSQGGSPLQLQLCLSSRTVSHSPKRVGRQFVVRQEVGASSRACVRTSSSYSHG